MYLLSHSNSEITKKSICYLLRYRIFEIYSKAFSKSTFFSFEHSTTSRLYKWLTAATALIQWAIPFFLLNLTYNKKVNRSCQKRSVLFMCTSFYSKSVIFYELKAYTAQKMKFSIKDFFSKSDQIRRKLRIWLHLLNKSLKVASATKR